MSRQDASTQVVVGQRWGDLAAAHLAPSWLGRVWEWDAQSLLLMDEGDRVVRLVTEEVGDGPLHVVVPDAAAPAWQMLPRGLYTWRVRDELWLGDDLTLRLPDTAPWQSTLLWQRARLAVPAERLSRHLALLSDWLLARAPEQTLASLLPDLLAETGVVEKAAERNDLAASPRLFRWRAARVLVRLMPALGTGDLATAEEAIHGIAGLGVGAPPAGDWFMLGLIAGIRLWPEFLSAGSGLSVESLLLRLTRSVIERTDRLGRATLGAALDDHWAEPWHTLHAALLAEGRYADDLRDAIREATDDWLAQDEPTAGAALAGLVLPFLWYQRFLT